MNLPTILARASAGSVLSPGELTALLSLRTPEERKLLRQTAYALKLRTVGNQVHLRGLIEFSNVCTRNCLYCGIRRSNEKIHRFCLTEDEILSAGRLAVGFGYGSVVIQSGERQDAVFTEFVTRVVAGLRTIPGMGGITLSCGEESEAVYRRWREAGADRYLLRIESSDPDLFHKIHPAGTSFGARVDALRRLRACDYQVGTGVMIGLPGQTPEQLARDVEFFRTMDIDMIGMGPWQPHKDAPLADTLPETPERERERLELALDMIACTRLQLKDVNIAAATALQAIDPEHGRQSGLLAGANVMMPNTGGVEHRREYTLYNGKPGLDENAQETRDALERSIRAIGEEIAYAEPGTSPHYTARKNR